MLIFQECVCPLFTTRIIVYYSTFVALAGRCPAIVSLADDVSSKKEHRVIHEYVKKKYVTRIEKSIPLSFTTNKFVTSEK